MNQKIDMGQALETWQKFNLEWQEDQQQDHLSVQRLYAFSLDGGLKTAEPYETAHLSLCPVCLDKWESFCIVSEPLTADDYEGEQDIIGHGTLKAASSAFKESIYTQSECRRFMLGIFPEIDRPGSGMAVLEVIDEQDSCENMLASVTDLNGKILLHGRIQEGRSASKIEDLGNVDLSSWTIVLTGDPKSKKRGMDKDE